MKSVRLKPVRWCDDNFPGWIEVELREADGAVARLVDKAPIFDDTDTLAPGSPLPTEFRFPCDVLSRDVDSAGNISALVRLQFGLEDRQGRTTFRVNGHDIVDTL
jgi:hypothetical protein